MHRKILGICLALVALGALVAVPLASAATLKDTTAGGVEDTIQPGKQIKGISEGISTFAAGNLVVECNENFITGTVVKNDGTNIEGTIEDAKFQSNLNASGTQCKTNNLGAATITIPALTNEPKNGGTNGTDHWCLKNVVGADSWTLGPNNCGAPGGEFTFVIDAAFGVNCYYKRVANITGTYTTNVNHEASTLSVKGGAAAEFEKEAPSSGLCPVGNGKIESMKFNLFTDTSVTPDPWDDAASTGDPVYITNP